MLHGSTDRFFSEFDTRRNNSLLKSVNAYDPLVATTSK